MSAAAVYPSPRRRPLAPWSGLEVAIALFLSVLIPQIAASVAVAARYIPAFGPDQPLKGRDLFRLLLVQGLSAPLILVAVLGLLWLVSRTRPRVAGLRWSRWRADLYVGYACFFVVTPIVLGMNYIANWLNKKADVEIQQHPLRRLVDDHPSLATWLLVVFQAVVLAPVIEELLFRGVLMRWLARRAWGGWGAMLGAIAMGAVMVDSHRGPLLFALGASLLGVLATMRDTTEQWMQRAIIGTGLLFAMFHMAVWPTPIPLLFLGIALGWSAHHTRGLLAPIILHALFNATSVLIMAMTGPEPAPPLKAEPPAVMRMAAR